jgi:hypothetical protein
MSSRRRAIARCWSKDCNRRATLACPSSPFIVSSESGRGQLGEISDASVRLVADPRASEPIAALLGTQAAARVLLAIGTGRRVERVRALAPGGARVPYGEHGFADATQ